MNTNKIEEICVISSENDNTFNYKINKALREGYLFSNREYDIIKIHATNENIQFVAILYKFKKEE